jgi:hypothetical protein
MQMMLLFITEGTIFAFKSSIGTWSPLGGKLELISLMMICTYA